MNKLKKVVLSNFWPDQNAGDFAIFMAQIEILNKEGVLDENIHILSCYKGESSISVNNFNHFTARGMKILPGLFPSLNKYGELISKVEKVLQLLKILKFSILCLFRSSKLLFMFSKGKTLRTLEAIEESDAVILKGGAFIIGFPGIRGSVFLLRNIVLVWISKTLGTKVIIMPHSFGPFANRFQKFMIRHIFNGVSIFSREELSYQTLEELNLHSTIVPDLAFSWSALEQTAIKKKNKIAFTIRPLSSFKSEAEHRKYYSIFASSIEKLLEDGFEISLVPQVTGPTIFEDDRVALKRVRALLNPKWMNSAKLKVLPGLTIGGLIKEYSSCETICGMRMHSVIFGLKLGCKVISISYLGPKHKGIMRSLNLEKFHIDLENLCEQVLLRKIYQAFSDQSVEENKKRIGQFIDVTNERISKSLVRKN
ncbi:MAG: hypothetical protein CML95_06590 [Rhodobiaceae bacterium]|nr:hypothetical protein [Rhodobiaceae bacterium]|tara:strand:- start:390 stop:1661 length:1272 start_codon:yes stop_codon:yes gene_type:complete